jgi:hypothetical protein
MEDNKNHLKRKPIAAEALRAQATALRASADTLDALADSESESAAPSDLLTVGAETRAQYHAGRESLMAAASRGELTLVRGGHRRVMVERAELERWIKSRPVVPGPRRAPAADLDAWDAQADRALKIVGRK